MTPLIAIPARVYFPPCTPASFVVSANTFYAHPFSPPRARAFDQIGLRIIGAGSAMAAVRLAIYTDRDGRPGDLLNQFGPAGVSAEGPAAVTLNPPSNLGARGGLWLACVFSEAAPLPTVAGVGASPRIGAAVGVASFGELPSDESDLAVGVRADMPYGAFPEMAPEVTPLTGGGVPLIGLRAL